MAEISTKCARTLTDDEARKLLSWRDFTQEDLVEGLTIQKLLDLYHASGKYFTLEDWLTEDPKARRQYETITGTAIY